MKQHTFKQATAYYLNMMNLLRKKVLSRALASYRWPMQIIGYVFYQFITAIIALLPVLIIIGAWALFGHDSFESACDWTGHLICHSKVWVGIIISNALVVETIWIVKKLTPIFSLRRQEIRITISQICILVAIGVWLFSLIAIVKLDDTIDLQDQKYVLILAAIGTLLTWIFQDTIKSVVAFLYVRINDMIHIGDWIKVDSKGIDGMVKNITLTMVTIENWDTTETSFPTYLLHSGSFTNLQNMLDGKTHGRRMLMDFTIDTGWIQPLSVAEAEAIAKRLDADDYFKESEFIKSVRDAGEAGEDVLNIHLYRLYIFHWLMNHHKVCRRPRLVVRYLQPSENGLPMQVYAYLTDISLEPFEWTQAGIVEHILESMRWFNLRLYQNASAFDVSNSNIFLAPETAQYKNSFDETSR